MLSSTSALSRLGFWRSARRISVSQLCNRHLNCCSGSLCLVTSASLRQKESEDGERGHHHEQPPTPAGDRDGDKEEHRQHPRRPTATLAPQGVPGLLFSAQDFLFGGHQLVRYW